MIGGRKKNFILYFPQIAFRISGLCVRTTNFRFVMRQIECANYFLYICIVWPYPTGVDWSNTLCAVRCVLYYIGRLAECERVSVTVHYRYPPTLERDWLFGKHH